MRHESAFKARNLSIYLRAAQIRLRSPLSTAIERAESVLYARDNVYICAGRSPDVHATAAERAHRTSMTSGISRSDVLPALVLLRSEVFKLVDPFDVSPNAVGQLGVARVLSVLAQRLDGHPQNVCSAPASDEVGFAC